MRMYSLYHSNIGVPAGIAAVLVVLGAASFARTDTMDDRAIPTVELPSLRGSTNAVLTAPPLVPATLDRDYATTVTVNLEVIEKQLPIADGATYTFWTFGGTVPGRFIRVREGDLVIFNLTSDAANQMPHNIDLHAVTGPGGGSAASIVLPGQEAKFEFRALKPGLYVYHCAMPGMAGTHIANGMYGLILVEDADNPLPPVDHEYYVMQGDFYTEEGFGGKGEQTFDFDKALAETPDYVLFNGGVGALAGENALQAKVGDTVRLYVGNGGPNLSSSFHVIGEVFDNVYAEGGSAVTHNVQTTAIPAGGAAIVEFRVDVPGDFHFVDHAIFRAQKGALGTIHVSGDDVATIFSGKDGPMGH